MLEFTFSHVKRKTNILQYAGSNNLTSVADPDCRL